MTHRLSPFNPKWSVSEKQHFEQLKRIAETTYDDHVAFPRYCLEDDFFIDPAYPVTIKCVDEETGDPLHVVLISSFNGGTWWGGIIEHKSFDVMTIEFEDPIE